MVGHMIGLKSAHPYFLKSLKVKAILVQSSGVDHANSRHPLQMAPKRNGVGEPLGSLITPPAVSISLIARTSICEPTSGGNLRTKGSWFKFIFVQRLSRLFWSSWIFFILFALWTWLTFGACLEVKSLESVAEDHCKWFFVVSRSIDPGFKWVSSVKTRCRSK